MGKTIRFTVIFGIYLSYMVGGLEHFSFFHILGIIIPTDFHIFQRCYPFLLNF